MFKKKHEDEYLDNEYIEEPDDTSEQQDDVETVVGPSVHVEGDFVSNGNIMVKGSVSGNVKTSKLLTTEPGSQILANVSAGDAIIAGNVKGNVKVSEQLEITATAQVLGDISCQVLVVEGGALIKGKVTMKGLSIDTPASKSRSKKAASKSDTSDTEETE